MRRISLLLFLLAACNPNRGEPEAALPNIVVIVLDTVRASAITPAATPVLQDLGARGVVFDNAFATHDATPASHFSIFTGLRDGMGGPLDHAENTLQYALAKLGYDTLAVIANGNVSPAVLRTAGGFNRLRNVHDEYLAQRPADLDAIVAAAGARFGLPDTEQSRVILAADASHIRSALAAELPNIRRPLFLFINLIDAHDPYVPPEPFSDDPPPGFAPDPRSRPLPATYRDPNLLPPSQRETFWRLETALSGGVWRISWDLSRAELATYERRYLAEVSALDAELGRLLELLSTAGVMDRSLLVVTADHGECFGERGLLTHSFSGLGDPDCVLHVPMVIAPPEATGPPSRVAERVSIADLAPTIYQAAGVDDAALREIAGYGRSLGALLGPGFRKRPTMTRLEPLRRRPGGDGIDAKQRERLRMLGYVE
jgi:arylsulfatase A-like enzyme